MKHILLILIITFTSLSCKAQVPILDILDRTSDTPDRSYFKDTTNFLNKFTGTWVYNSGNTVLTIIIEKRLQVYTGDIYEDLLVGEYQYIENGIEKINTLNQINTISNSESYKHNLYGNYDIYPNEFPACDNCSQYEKRVKLDFTDPTPTLSHLNGMVMGLRYLNDNNSEQLQIDFEMNGIITLPNGAQQEPSLPFGRYTLIKQ